MNPARYRQNDFAAARSWLRMAAGLAGLGTFLAGAGAAMAQTTNAPAATNAPGYSSFQIIVERNIFDPNRYAHSARSREHTVAQAVPAFSLVGTMSSRQGMLAFFDGNDTDYRKVLPPNGVIAGYKVVAITLRGVQLEAAGKRVVMTVGAQMRQENKGQWQLAAPGESPVTPTGTETADADAKTAPGPATGSDNEPNDVLKKLMQQREQELK